MRVDDGDYLRCYPNDGYDDDRPGCMRVHVAAARADVLVQRMSKIDLKGEAGRRGIPKRGTKWDIAWLLVQAGMRP